ncbi:MAG: hypothetical protein ACYCQJ_14670 [Nitrososphaerales archaeon]
MSGNGSSQDYDVVAYASHPPSNEDCSEVEQPDLEQSHPTSASGCDSQGVCPLKSNRSSKVDSIQTVTVSDRQAPCGRNCQKPCQCEKCLRVAIFQLKETLKWCRDRRYRKRYDNYYGDYSGSGNYFDPRFCPRGFTGIRPDDCKKSKSSKSSQKHSESKCSHCE